MVKTILCNIKTGLTIARENKLIFFFLLSAMGLTGSNAYLTLIPPHPYTAPKPVTVINKTIIKKVSCDTKCKKIMFGIAKQVVDGHNKEGHTY